VTDPHEGDVVRALDARTRELRRRVVQLAAVVVVLAGVVGALVVRALP